MARALLLALAAAFALPATAAAEDLTIYSSLPLAGVSRPQSEDIVRGEQLASSSRRPRRRSRSASSRSTTPRRAGMGRRGARRATRGGPRWIRTTIAYLGEFNSGASAISLPILNEAGILQVSPSNAYVGLTAGRRPSPASPSKYYPSDVRTFGRAHPPDHLQAAAIAALLQQERAKRVYLVDDSRSTATASPTWSGAGSRRAAQLRRPPHAAQSQRRRDRPGDPPLEGRRDGLRRHRRERRGAAVARRPPPQPAAGAVRCRGRDRPAFTRRLSRGAARRTLITNPTARSRPPTRRAAQAFYAAFRARFGREPEPYAI